MAALIDEMHHLEGDTRRLIMLMCQRTMARSQPAIGGAGSQPGIEASFAGQAQQTLREMWLDPANESEPVDLTPKELCMLGSPGNNYLRTLFLEVYRARRRFTFCWREQNVGGVLFQGDHHCKALKFFVQYF